MTFFNLDINYRNFTNDYNSYLITAALKEKWSLVKVLIERKIDVNGRDATGTTGLMYAAYCGQAEAVQLLLSAGADPSIKYRGEETALDLAKEGETRETPFCSSKGNYTQTIEKLTIALKNWTQPYQDMKYDHEHYPNQPYVYKGIGFTKPQIQLLLFSVLTREPEEFLKVFDFFNLDINYQNPSIDSYSYLIAATFSEKWSLVQPLLQRKTNVNLRDSGNSTAIMYSAFLLACGIC